jgi:hypothetical protein
MILYFGIPLFSVSEVSSLSGMHPNTVRDKVKVKPEWHKFRSGNLYVTESGIRDVFNLTADEYERFMSRSLAGKTGSL